MELSLYYNRNGSDGGGSSIEKEHMFDKVVTPSDVGKLNRLVIPKQHAEKYFPLDSSSSEKCLLLNFEDRNGKPWRFRYSYWNSSQSYVMTKGWSRFVKDKKLDAGDIVSFQRGVGDSEKHRFFIDWRRRPNNHVVAAHDHVPFGFLQNPPQHDYFSSSTTTRLYASNGQTLTPLQHFNIYNKRQNHSQQVQLQRQYTKYDINYSQQRYLTEQSRSSSHQFRELGASGSLIAGDHCGGVTPMVIEGMPIIPTKTAGKRLRLFGVNMECDTQNNHPLPSPSIQHSSSSSSTPPQYGAMGSFISSSFASSLLEPSFPQPTGAITSVSATSITMPSTIMQVELSKKGKSRTSFSFDLDEIGLC